MTIWTLVRAAIRKQKKSLAGLSVLVLVTTVSLSLAVTVYCNSSAVISSQMQRLGYGALTAWVSNCGNLAELGEELEMQEGVEKVRIQPLVFAGYLINGSHSDNDGELIAYRPEEYDYHFFSDELDGYRKDASIRPGEIYLSPAMKSSFHAEVGDEIRFELSRADTGLPFTVAGFFEDPFMGSSMVDMKSFLVSESDYEKILNILDETSAFNLLGRQGAMIHIFSEESAGLSIIEMNRMLNEQTSLGRYSEMMYSQETIYGFMLLLQNILAGFLIAFSGLLLVVILIVLANLIKNTLEQEYADIGILKTIGCSGGTIGIVQVLQYICPVIAGTAAGIVLAMPIAHAAANLTVTSTGILMSGNLPGAYLAVIFLLVICGIAAFILAATKQVLSIRPLQAITGRNVPPVRIKGQNPIRKGMLGISLAVRQLLTGRRRYAGVLTVTALLTLFAAVVGRLEAWVGPGGEGLMNSFSVAEHDLGIQPAAGDFDMAPVEEMINSYSPITDVYRIAMQNGSVNGVDYTINVLDKPEWFHILEGETAAGEDQLLVTAYVADDLDIAIGDTVVVSYGGQSGEYTVSGIYECANGMGANVGMSIDGYARIGDIMEDIWCYHYIIEDGSLRDTVMEALMARYRLEADIHNNSWTGLDGIVSVLHMVILIMYGVTALIIGIVVALSSHRVLSAEQKELAVYKSIGLTVSGLRTTFSLRYGLTAAAGTAAGTLLAAVCADSVVSMILRNFGIGGFRSEIGAMDALLPAFVVTILAFIFAWCFGRQIKTVSVTRLLQDE